MQSPNTALEKSKLFNRTLNIAVIFVKYIIGSIAVAYVVRSGLRLTLYGGSEEEVSKDKKNIYYGMLGLIFILFAFIFYRNFFHKNISLNIFFVFALFYFLYKIFNQLGFIFGAN